MISARNARRLADKAAATRVCGDCTECCTILGVPELNKSKDEPCRHERLGKGCLIYPQRPNACKAFDCLWKQGLLEKEDRPDRLGIMLTVTDPNSQFGKQCIVAYETRSGGFTEAAQTLKKLANSSLLILIDGDTRTFMGPPGEVQRAQQFAEQMEKRKLPVLG